MSARGDANDISCFYGNRFPTECDSSSRTELLGLRFRRAGVRRAGTRVVLLDGVELVSEGTRHLSCSNRPLILQPVSDRTRASPSQFGHLLTPVCSQADAGYDRSQGAVDIGWSQCAPGCNRRSRRSPNSGATAGETRLPASASQGDEQAQIDPNQPAVNVSYGVARLWTGIQVRKVLQIPRAPGR